MALDSFTPSSGQNTGGGQSYLLTSESTHAAMAAKKLLADLSPTVMPTPRSITANCGMTLKMTFDDDMQAMTTMLSLLEERGVYKLYARNQESLGGSLGENGADSEYRMVMAI